MKVESSRIAIIGLGYVGLPLAVAFSRHLPVYGFDINQSRVDELNNGKDRTAELDKDALLQLKNVVLSSNLNDLSECNVWIVTVPTPVNRHNYPDLSALESASKMLGGMIKAGDTVIYESTVYPGATEEVCIPLLEQHSGLKINQDFYCGYSPERINPGDKENSLEKIVKVTSASCEKAAHYVDALYQLIIKAGTHRAASIQVAEAAKAIENTQRDVNIALMNEFAMMFKHLNLDTEAVLSAAASKWNFLPFKPGLVGGHCIGVDPYYLIHKASEAGYYPALITSSRRINDGMSHHVTSELVRLMTQKKISVVDSNVLIMGLAFKENCPDLRNTRVVEIIEELNSYHANIDVYDPWVDAEEAKNEYGLTLVNKLNKNHYDAILIAVGHKQFKEMGAEKIRALGKENNIIFDVKYLLPSDMVDGRL